MTVAAATLPQIICAWLTWAEMKIGNVLDSDTVKNKAISNSFQLNINTNIATVAMPPFDKGMAIFKNIWNQEAPSILDASIKSMGIFLKNDAETHTANGILKAV